MALLKATTFMAMAEPKRALLKEFKEAVRDDDLRKVKEILAEVERGAKGRYRVQQDDGYVAIAHVETLVNDRSDNGCTALHDVRSQDMKAFLISKGADPSREDLNGIRADMDELGDALEKFPIGIPRRGSRGVNSL